MHSFNSGQAHVTHRTRLRELSHFAVAHQRHVLAHGLARVGHYQHRANLGFALYITYRSRQSTTELVHNAAVCLWIVANSLWMLGEFFYEDTTRPIAVWFFAGGLGLVISYYLSRLAALFRGRGQAS